MKVLYSTDPKKEIMTVLSFICCNIRVLSLSTELKALLRG
jgi:hypothetical protein